MSKIRRVVLDVLKPHSPSIIDLANILADIEGIDGVDISLKEMDQKVENVKITCEGPDINFSQLEKAIIENGGSVHSIDKISAGTSLVEEVVTSQD
ncbi:MAG: DUF211 domain-containing protein [Actinomycetota bacterium]|jgi:hypothetical protein|nr:DUF211 domain-containing protein [Actinomycetota bacterium]